MRRLEDVHDGQRVAALGSFQQPISGEIRRLVLVWDISTRQPIWVQPIIAISAHKGTVCFSDDGAKLFVGESDGRIRRRDILTGKIDLEWRAYKDAGITATALSPDGTMLASGAGYGDGDIKLWKVTSGERIATLPGHNGWVSCLEFSADGATLYSSSADQTARIWEIQNFRQKAVLRGHRDELYALAQPR